MQKRIMEFDQDCSWFINNDNTVIGIGSVEGMLLQSKTDLYDYLAKEVGDEANKMGMRFYDFRETSSYDDINVRELCKFSQYILDTKGTEKDIDNVLINLKKLKQKKHNGTKRQRK